MTVIAMPHEIGTCGRRIASRLAARLGIEFADEHFLGHRIADRLSRGKARFDRRFGQHGAFDDWLDVDDADLARHAEAEIQEQAAYGNILMRGWGASTVLRDNPHVLRIRVTAPTEFRISRLARKEHYGDRHVLSRMIWDADRCLASNLEPVFGQGWQSGDMYHVTLLSHLLPLEDAVEQLAAIVDAAVHPAGRARRRKARLHRPRPVQRWPRRIGSRERAVDPASLSEAEHVLFAAH